MKKTSSNKNLHKANKAKKDEFYTQLSDIERELGHYKESLKGKIVFCNCDDPEESNFWHYFAENFEFLGLKKLVSTHFEKDKPSYKLEIQHDVNKDGKKNKLDTIKTPLKQNGDFRSDECVEILKEADVVVTNPPFSLFREYVAQLIEFDKKFV
ncbi:MAG: modification methylase, partial [Candidatus Moranbacteria bacterium]|nr:modification methylase [Candidatus Moranbacteria bacterium]